VGDRERGVRYRGRERDEIQIQREVWEIEREVVR